MVVAPIPTINALGGLVVLAVAVLPLGLTLVRAGERFVGRRIRFSTPERVLLAIYSVGGFLFLVASIPAPLYCLPVIVGLLIIGIVAYTILTIRERGAGLRSAFLFVRSGPALLLVALTIGLLATEVVGVANLSLGNGLDGSVYSLFINLLLANHTVPWTLNPYAAVGVAYPQAASVWMTLPVLFFGWPIVTAPLVVPALFLSLSVVGAYCLGDRLSDRLGRKNGSVGLLFAAFFGVVAGVPRLLVGGSYDFAICLPLFFVVLGWLVPFVASPLRPWKEVIAFGVVIGIASSLSPMVGLTLLLLILGFVIAFRSKPGLTTTQWAARWLAICCLGGLSVLRSLVAVAVWFNYPGHILIPVGNPPPASVSVTDTLSYRFLTGNLDPFIVFKAKLSPFPWQSVEIQVFLGLGLLLIIWLELRPKGQLSLHLPRTMVRPIVAGTIIVFLETSGVIMAGAINTTAGGVQSLVNIQEMSYLLFIFYELIALLPLVVALSYLSKGDGPIGSPHLGAEQPKKTGWQRTRSGRRVSVRRPRVILVSLVLIITLSSGAVGTGLQVPNFIQSEVTKTANISQGDILALEWSGSHLPTCSQVLVAPGSVGQYLPEYAHVGIVFPAFPTPANRSYQLVVSDLENGVYSNNTRAGLMELGVTTVFASGQTSVTYLPILLPPIESSADFSILYASGDAAVLEFIPGATSNGCLP
jgi:hypothetical protein